MHHALRSSTDSAGSGLPKPRRHPSGQPSFHPRKVDPSEFQLLIGVLQVGNEGVMIPLPPPSEAKDRRVAGGCTVGVVDPPQQVLNPEATFTKSFAVHHSEAGHEGDH